VKFFVTFIHLLWAGFWTSLIAWKLSVITSRSSWLHQSFDVALAIITLTWLVFAILLLLRRRMAWHFCFISTLLSLLYCLQIIAQTIGTLPAQNRWSFLLESTGLILLPVLILSGLWYIKRPASIAHDQAT